MFYGIAPILDTTAPNGIVGSWSPAILDNLNSGSYVFTPATLLFPCAISQSLSVNVLAEPKLKEISICLDQTTNNVLKTYVLNTGLSNSNYTFKWYLDEFHGYNDNWNLIGLSDQPFAKIYIFDRYGKLIKQISSVEEGWDGTYRGQIMPATDYWFTVEYSELSTTKVFKSHFSLLR